MTTAALVVVPLLAGATVQRSTGLGLALVGAPFVVAVLGPRDGVSFGNALQIVLCALVLAGTWRGTDRRAVALLLVGAAVGVPLGALVVVTVPEAPLLVVVGCLAGVGVALSAFPVAGRMLVGTPGGLGAGAAAGFVNAAAGVGGPLVSAYALARRLPPERFVPTAQAVLLAINAVALAVKGVPDLDPVVWLAGLVAISVGTVLGGPVSRRLSATVTRRIVLVLALAGAAATVVRGLVEL
jgi:uncharacterized membrane protein YfcA